MGKYVIAIKFSWQIERRNYTKIEEDGGKL